MKLHVINRNLRANRVTPVSTYLTIEKFSDGGYLRKRRRPCNANTDATTTAGVVFQPAVEPPMATPKVVLPANGNPSFNFSHISFGLTC